MMIQRTTRPSSCSRLVFLQVILIGSTFLLHNCFCYSPTTQSSSSCRRRQLFIDSAWVAVQVGLVSSSFTTAPAFAAAAPTTKTPPADSIAYDRVQIGHARIQYLLDHWDEVTSVCGTTIMSDTERRQVIRTENGNQCTKTPLRVQDYMGYKSINDPLYRIDKYLLTNSMISAKVKADDLVDYLEAVEAFKEKADQTAMLAYTSSWGEANPNGSKETVDAYLDQTKTFVVESEKQLRRILGFLHLEPIPPLQKA